MGLRCCKPIPRCPEPLDSSLRSARAVLELLGQPTDAAQQAAEQFRAHNLDLFERMYPHRNDREKFIAVAKQGRRQLEAQMRQERESLTGQGQGQGQEQQR